MDVRQRWLLLVPPDAIVLSAADRSEATRRVRALPAGTAVALTGRWGLRWLARRCGLRVDAVYIALPSLATPVAITRCTPQALRHAARTVLTVPSGVTTLHLPVWLAARLTRALPGLMACAPVGDRLLVGARR